ncbi:MAG: UDP-N-acetylmuramate--L-alanine ligase [Chitinophagales bacterium]|nr:UDP-N-acetylmuramate--L-alanine ligase [Chitinophagales bacterium]
MHSFNNIQQVYFLGIGGIGMSALARYFNKIGVQVTGYDKTPTELTNQLQQEGITITFEDSIDTLNKNADLVIYTPAIPKNHIQYNWYLEHNFTIKKRAVVLGEIANQYFQIAVAGSHGKTSTASIVTHILKTANKDVAAFLGGIATNYNTNFLFGNQYAVVEADEFDRSFMSLKPNLAIITAIDSDHLDIYGDLSAIEKSFTNFTYNIKNDGCIVHHLSVKKELLNPEVKNISYHFNDTNANVYTQNFRIENNSYVFDINVNGNSIADIHYYYGGKHNIENALAAVTIAYLLEIDTEHIKTALATFKGVKRRFEIHHQSNKYILIDDYAHHPKELEAVIHAVKELYPNKQLTVVFQPHLYSRTKDFYKEFAQSLSLADTVLLFDIYPARELPIEGVTSQLILDEITTTKKQIVAKEALVNTLKNINEKEIILTVGAGDINLLIDDIKTMLTNE